MANLNVIFVVGVIFMAVASIRCMFISNLDDACMRCLCEAATSCNSTSGCIKGYCGPFHVSRDFWVDSGKYVLPIADPEREGAYEDCANNYNCAKVMVENYMAKYGRDCNSDGVTDCDDYAMIHFNGGFQCNPSLEGLPFYNRYTRCRPPKTETEEEDFVGNERTIRRQ